MTWRARWNNFKATPTKLAYRWLCRELRRDPGYLNVWRSHVSMTIYDKLPQTFAYAYAPSIKQTDTLADTVLMACFDIPRDSIYRASSLNQPPLSPTGLYIPRGQCEPCVGRKS